MRCVIELTPKRKFGYKNNYNKRRGVVWTLLQGTTYEDYHGEENKFPFVFSPYFPFKQTYTPEDTVYFVIASPHTRLIDKLSQRLESVGELNFGEMGFYIDNIIVKQEDVGDIGESGTLRTNSGIYYKMDDGRSWTQDDGVNVLLENVADDIERRQDRLAGEHHRSPDPYELFDSVEVEKEYAVKPQVTSGAGHKHLFILNKIQFDYTVESNDHRRWLNMMLETGIGYRNTLGFGFVDTDNDE